MKKKRVCTKASMKKSYDEDSLISDYNKTSVDSVAASGQVSGTKSVALLLVQEHKISLLNTTIRWVMIMWTHCLKVKSFEEEFKFKAKTIFEAAVNDRVSQIQNELQESYSEWADLKVEKIRDGLVERVDSYLNYVIKEWMEENKLALENGIQNEINESFVNGIKTLFETHNINLTTTHK